MARETKLQGTWHSKSAGESISTMKIRMMLPHLALISTIAWPMMSICYRVTTIEKIWILLSWSFGNARIRLVSRLNAKTKKLSISSSAIKHLVLPSSTACFLLTTINNLFITLLMINFSLSWILHRARKQTFSSRSQKPLLKMIFCNLDRATTLSFSRYKTFKHTKTTIWHLMVTLLESILE